MRPTATLLCFLLALLLPALGYAQQAPTLVDDFNRPDSPTVGTGWLETETVAGTGASVTSQQLRLSSGVLGRDFVARDLSARYEPVLSANAGPLTWAFNMQQSRPNPSGFAANNYGAAVVLAGSTSDFTTGNGYAVTYGNTGQPDSLRLVRYTGGLTAPANLRTLVAQAVPVAATATTGPALTVRVRYSPDENNWTLEVSANTTSFEDPATAVFVRVGGRQEATYTATALPWLGCFWNHATTASESAVFDNLSASAPCALGPEPTQGPTAPAAVFALNGTGATLSWSPGTGSQRLVIVRPAGAAAAVPEDGAVYLGDARLGSGTPLGTGGAYAVYVGAAGTVAVTGLLPGTAYAYQVYELLGAGCATNYLQATPATGTFTTASCQLASFPAQDATNARAVAAGRTAATFSWTPGSGTSTLVVVKPHTTLASALPSTGQGYAASLVYGVGSALGGGYVVYAGPAATTSVTVTNLVPGTAYRVEVYPYNGAGCSAAYTTSFFAYTVYTVPAPAVGTLLAWRGNLHAHSAFSDGNQDAASSGASTPLQSFQYADASLQVDFLGISDHNHSQAGMQRPNYRLGLQQAQQATNAQFVALYGMEWGVISNGGHMLVYGVDQLLGWEAGNYDEFVARSDYPGLFRAINRRPGAFATLAHPQSGDYGNLGGATTPFSARADSAIVGTVLRSGPATSTNTSYSNPSSTSYEATFRTLLAKGYHVGISLDHDNHNTTFGRTTAGRLVVLAPALTRADLLDALRQRRFYAADDWNAEVSFTLNQQPMGSIFTGQGVAQVQVSVSDLDGEGVSSLTLLRGVPGSGSGATVVATAVAGATALSYVDELSNLASAYYYVLVTQTDGDRLVTSPIWYTRQIITATQGPSSPTLALSVFPNPTSAGATVSYFLATGTAVSAAVYDALGRRVLTLADEQAQAPGSHSLPVPAGLPAGVYVVQLRAGREAAPVYQRLVVE